MSQFARPRLDVCTIPVEEIRAYARETEGKVSAKYRDGRAHYHIRWETGEFPKTFQQWLNHIGVQGEQYILFDCYYDDSLMATRINPPPVIAIFRVRTR